MPPLNHTIQGEGEPIVLLHSGGMTHREWDPHRDRLAKRLRVITPDLPGHGRSPLEGDTLRIDEMAQAVLDLLDTLDLDRTHLLGSSLGGAVALRLALEHPGRIDQLVLFRIGYRPGPDREANATWMREPEHWAEMGLAERLSRWHEPQGGPEAWKDVIDRVASTLDPDHPREGVTLEDLGSIQAPSLLIAGDRDPLVPLGDVLDMYRAIPEADLWIVPHATHVTAAHTWRAEHFDKEILRFLRSPRHR